MPIAGIRPPRGCGQRLESPLLDVIYVLTAVAVFALVGLVARGVESLVPREDAPGRGDGARLEPAPSARATEPRR